MTVRMKTISLLFFLLMAFSACASPSSDGEAANIEGVDWRLAEINGSAPVENTKATLKLENGQAGGNTSCNSYGGKYSLEGSKLSFAEVMQTDMACMDPGVMEQESAFTTALLQTSSFAVVGERLELKDAGGKTILAFEQ